MPGNWLSSTATPHSLPQSSAISRPSDETSSNRGASPLGLPYTLSRAPLRRRAPFPWLARNARSRLGTSVRFMRYLLISLLLWLPALAGSALLAGTTLQLPPRGVLPPKGGSHEVSLQKPGIFVESAAMTGLNFT